MIFPNAKPMMCGGCGNGLFKMFEHGNRIGGGVALLAECTKCKSVSRIGVSQPEIQIDWTEGSDGLLTKGEPTC